MQNNFELSSGEPDFDDWQNNNAMQDNNGWPDENVRTEAHILDYLGFGLGATQHASTSFNDGSEEACYWTSTRADDESAFFRRADLLSYTYHQGSLWNTIGIAVRCIRNQ